MGLHTMTTKTFLPALELFMPCIYTSGATRKKSTTVVIRTQMTTVINDTGKSNNLLIYYQVYRSIGNKDYPGNYRDKRREKND
jgi:hypothetical protein